MESTDPKDEAIIEILRTDARRPYVEIARRVGLSEAAVRRRVSNLVAEGVIRRFTVEVEAGGVVHGLILVLVAPAVRTPSVSEVVRKVRGVEVVYEITGEYDVAAVVSASNIAEVNRCVDEIRRVQGVTKTNTMIVLRVLR